MAAIRTGKTSTYERDDAELRSFSNDVYFLQSIKNENKNVNISPTNWNKYITKLYR